MEEQSLEQYLIESLKYLNEDCKPVTKRNLELLKENVEASDVNSAIVSGLWTGYLAGIGELALLDGNDLTVDEQVDELIKAFEEKEGE